MSIVIPYKTLDLLRCDSCLNFLSCAPITTDGQRVFCGRCVRLPNHCHFYTKVAAHFLFPCKYWSKHCTNGGRYDEITKHESHCTWRNGCIVFCAHPASMCRRDRQMNNCPSKFDLVRISPDVLNALGKCYGCNGSITSSPIYTNDEHVVCYRCAYENLQSYTREISLETLLAAFLFPCNFKEWGCTEYHRFGKENETHEQQCAYRPSPVKVSRQPSQAQADADGKVRGIIQSHRGAMWGTISPNHHVFVKETETTKRHDDGQIVPVKKGETMEQALFHNDLRHNQQQRRMMVARSDPEERRNHRQRSILRNGNAEVHGADRYHYPRAASSCNNDGSQYSDTSSYHDRTMHEMRESIRSENYPSQLGVPRLQEAKKPSVARGGSYYDTNYNKVLQEFNYKNRRRN